MLQRILFAKVIHVMVTVINVIIINMIDCCDILCRFRTSLNCIHVESNDKFLVIILIVYSLCKDPHRNVFAG